MKKDNASLSFSENISSNSIFHFTNSFENLKSILKKGFKISYVSEKLFVSPVESLFYIAPMVCFCDIPLGGIKAHLSRYGDFGLGIHKSYCKMKKINPVFYIYRASTFNHIFPDISLKYATIIPYIKRYYGTNITGKGPLRFYNEREWRYIEKDKIEILNESNLVKKKCEELNKNINHYLDFGLDKVEYIIVKNKTLLSTMVNFIDGELEIDQQEKKILYTKIISSTRIKNDF